MDGVTLITAPAEWHWIHADIKLQHVFISQTNQLTEKTNISLSKCILKSSRCVLWTQIMRGLRSPISKGLCDKSMNSTKCFNGSLANVYIFFFTLESAFHTLYLQLKWIRWDLFVRALFTFWFDMQTWQFQYRQPQTVSAQYLDTRMLLGQDVTCLFSQLYPCPGDKSALCLFRDFGW